MKRAMTAVLLLLGAGVSTGATAQPRGGLSLVGVWAGETQGQGGMVHGADQFNPDGSYVSAMQLPNGTVQRIWGRYQVQPAGSGRTHLSLQMEGFLPRRICAQAPGFAVQCRDNQVPPTAEMDVAFLSPSAIEINGITERRTGGSPVLQAQVPEQLVLAARAPTVPHMRQPVMPYSPGHYTPTGPGSVQGMHQDDQMQQYRICAVNGGQVVREQGGTVRCVN